MYSIKRLIAPISVANVAIQSPVAPAKPMAPLVIVQLGSLVVRGQIKTELGTFDPRQPTIAAGATSCRRPWVRDD